MHPRGAARTASLSASQFKLRCPVSAYRQIVPPLEIAVTVLLIAWILGLLSSYTFDGGIHLCLILALALLALRLTRRSPRGRGHGPETG